MKNKCGPKIQSRQRLLFIYSDQINGLCNAYNITRDELFSAKRDAKFVNARRRLAEIMRKDEISLSQIGLVLNRDHSTIINLLDPKKYRL